MYIPEPAWKIRKEEREYARRNLRTFLAMREMFHYPYFKDNETERALTFKKLDTAIDEAIAVECKRMEEIECEYREQIEREKEAERRYIEACKKYEEEE